MSGLLIALAIMNFMTVGLWMNRLPGPYIDKPTKPYVIWFIIAYRAFMGGLLLFAVMQKWQL